MCREFAGASGARITITDDPDKAVSGVDFIHTDVWVSMGEPLETWGERIDMLLPFQVNSALMKASGNPRVKFMHCLPAYHNCETKVGAKIAAQYPFLSNGIEVTDDVFESPANIAFEQAENRMHTIKAVLVSALAELTAMRIVIALGGNALLQRGQPMTADNQRANIRVAAERIAAIAPGNEIVVAHGNGPQVGLLALQSAAYHDVAPYPLDVLGAQTEAMIGYVIEQELGNLLPADQPLATLLTMIEVDRNDPAFDHPTKPIGPVYDRETAERLRAGAAGPSRRTATSSAESSPAQNPCGSSRFGRSEVWSTTG